jgi:hypothetical protein
MRIFTAPGVWHGGTFELSIELGPPDDMRLRAAFEAVWACPDLEGIYLDREREPEAQPKLAVSEVDPMQQSARGVAYIPGGPRVPCYSDVIREEGASDWLNLSLPVGGLHRAFLPIRRTDNQAWVEDWLASIGRRVYAQAPFELGLIGFLMSGIMDAQYIRQTGIPEQRHVGYLWPDAGDLIYLRRTEPSRLDFS